MDIDAPLAVIGAGLTGLAIAFRAATRGRRVVLVDRAQRLGGQIHTHEEGGVRVELGAEGFVARSSLLPALCRDLGIEDALVDQATTLTFALVDGELVPLAPGEAATLLGFQVPKEELGRGIRSLALGMGQLTDRLERAIEGQAEILRGDAAVAVFADPSDHARVVLASGKELRAKGVAVATPAAVAARVLRPMMGEEAAAALEGGVLLSNASVSLRYASDQLLKPLEGSGLIVPAGSDLFGARAISFVTTKFARPVPPGTILLRVFFRPTDEQLASRGDAAWIDVATRAAASALGVRGAPVAAWASVWPRALPVYDDAYRTAVAQADLALAPFGVRLAGSHFHGAGIDAAIASAERAADALVGRPGGRSPS